MKDTHGSELRAVNVRKTYVSQDIETTALDTVSITVKPGEFLAVTGPSGCGKSTLLSVLGMLEPIDSGSYFVDGIDVGHLSEGERNLIRRGRVGFIFQNFNLVEYLTIEQNIRLALRYSDIEAEYHRDRCRDVLAQLGILHRGRHFPSQLSGGQQQRAAIARALACDPTVVLADEPAGNLDSARGLEVIELLLGLSSSGTTVVMVTHTEAHAKLADRCIEMLDGRTQLSYARQSHQDVDGMGCAH